MKGSAVLKKKTKKWAQVYREWYESRHDTMIVHCSDIYVLNHARRAAMRFRDNNGLTGMFSISRYNGDLYLMRIGHQNYAMEVTPDEDGWIFYYDTKKEISKND